MCPHSFPLTLFDFWLMFKFVNFLVSRKGDYHRYLAEFETGNDRKEAAENSLVAYKAASDIAMTELPPTHPIRSETYTTHWITHWYQVSTKYGW